MKVLICTAEYVIELVTLIRSSDAQSGGKDPPSRLRHSDTGWRRFKLFSCPEAFREEPGSLLLYLALFLLNWRDAKATVQSHVSSSWCPARPFTRQVCCRLTTDSTGIQVGFIAPTMSPASPDMTSTSVLGLVDALDNARHDEPSWSREHTRRRVNAKSTLKRGDGAWSNVPHLVRDNAELPMPVMMLFRICLGQSTRLQLRTCCSCVC